MALNYLSFQVNILSGDAKDILTLNRDDIQSKFNKTLCEKVMKTAVGFLKTYYDELDEELKNRRPCSSITIYLMMKED